MAQKASMKKALNINRAPSTERQHMHWTFMYLGLPDPQLYFTVLNVCDFNAVEILSLDAKR